MPSSTARSRKLADKQKSVRLELIVGRLKPYALTEENYDKAKITKKA